MIEYDENGEIVPPGKDDDINEAALFDSYRAQAQAILEALAKPQVLPKTETELMLEDFTKEIQSLATDKVDKGHEAALENQMRVMDMMFRGLAIQGAEYHNADSYKSALRVQTCYRRTWAALNFMRAHGADAVPLPPKKNET